MAMYHCSVKTISRSSGRSAVGAAAYRAGDKLTNEYDGMTHDYSKKGGVEYSEIMLPKNAPEEYINRGKLWNAVEKSETRINSRTAREIEIALPIELDRQSHIKLLQDYIQGNFVNRGMCADLSIHDKGDGNPHAHVMLTTREISPDGFTKKNRDWDKRENVEQWREAWANSCNREFERQNIPERIDHRTLQAQGLDREPTIHLGTEATQMEKRGIASDRGNYNREVTARNLSYQQDIEEVRREVKVVQELQSRGAAAPIGANAVAPQAKKISIKERLAAAKPEDVRGKEQIPVDREVKELPEPPSRGAAELPPEKMSIKERMAAAKIEVNRKNAERVKPNIPKKRIDLQR